MRPGFFLDNFDGFIGAITVAVMARGLKKDSKLGVIVSPSLSVYAYIALKIKLRTRKTLAVSLLPCSRYAFLLGEISQLLILQWKNPDKYKHEILVVIGDLLTMSEQSASYKRATGRPLPSIPGFLAASLLAVNKSTQELWVFICYFSCAFLMPSIPVSNIVTTLTLHVRLGSMSTLSLNYISPAKPILR